jgi:hypothetical protein
MIRIIKVFRWVSLNAYTWVQDSCSKTPTTFGLNFFNNNFSYIQEVPTPKGPMNNYLPSQGTAFPFQDWRPDSLKHFLDLAVSAMVLAVFVQICCGVYQRSYH